MLSKLPLSFLYIVGALFTINIFQAMFTELIFDEAYYWHYASQLEWGYFDHPPMVAWLIKISDFIFDGELGVRFMSCVLSAGTLILLWLTVEHKKKDDFIVYFFIIAFSMTLLNAYGFFTLPDTPLLFFTALFLFIYKKFISSPSVLLAVIMGLTMAALMYSKYHAVLVIVFVLFSNLKLILDRYAILAISIALVCYIPHLNWLYENDFVSIKYHLFDRPNSGYTFEKNTLGFFLNLLALFGFTFPFVYYSLFKTKANNLFTKALLYLTYGIIIFFFVSSFSKRIQTQWLIIISIPLVLLVFMHIIENERTRRGILISGVATIVVLLVLRVGLIYKPLFPIHYETHGNEEWVSKLHFEAWTTPIVFENSYRNAPMYEFYSGRQAISLNNINYRKNQYSIDDSELNLQHQKVLYISKYLPSGSLAFPRKDSTIFYGKYIENFESFRKLECILPEEGIELNKDTLYTLKVYNPYKIDIPLEKLKFGLAYLNNHKELRDQQALSAKPIDPKVLTLRSNDTTQFKFKLAKTRMRIPAYIRIGISENDLPYGLNSAIIKLK